MAILALAVKLALPDREGVMFDALFACRFDAGGRCEVGVDAAG